MLIARPLGKNVAKFRFGLGFAQIPLQQEQAGYPYQRQSCGHRQHGNREAQQCQQCTTQEETHTF